MSVRKKSDLLCLSGWLEEASRVQGMVKGVVLLSPDRAPHFTVDFVSFGIESECRSRYCNSICVKNFIPRSIFVNSLSQRRNIFYPGL